MPKVQNEFHRLRLAYDLYGFIKLTNALEPWQVDSLEEGFDRIYIRQTGVNPNYSKERLPPIGRGCEVDFDYMKTFASASHVLDAIKAIAGADFQFLAADILCVYDDSIGPHRDLLYEFDTPKALIFLSDCNGGSISVPEASILRDFAGSFAVLSGSHLPGSLYNSLASQLTDWPDPSESARMDLTPNFLRGDTKPSGESLYPFLDYDSRYQGYSLIPFKRGDVVIFSPRAIHALLPTLNEHYAKLASFVFIEGYSKATGTHLKECDVELMTDREFNYVSLPYNSRLNDLLMRGADFDDSLNSTDHSPSSLSDLLANGDRFFNYVFEPLTKIYRICEVNIHKFTERRRLQGREIILGDFLRINQQHRDMLNEYHSRVQFHDFLDVRGNDSEFQNDISAFRDGLLMRHSASGNTAQPVPQEQVVSFFGRLKKLLSRD